MEHLERIWNLGVTLGGRTSGSLDGGALFFEIPLHSSFKLLVSQVTTHHTVHKMMS
jgi:hypothetical protein